MGRLGPMLGLSWAPLGPSWALQASPWGHPGPSLDFPRAPWCHLEPSWAHLGPNWSLWGAFLALMGTFLAPLGAVLELAWGHLGNIFGPNWGHVEAIGGSLHLPVYLSFSCLPIPRKNTSPESLEPSRGLGGDAKRLQLPQLPHYSVGQNL